MISAVRSLFAACAVQKFPVDANAESVRIYAKVLTEHGVNPDEVSPATVIWMGRSNEFPRPADIIEIVKAERAKGREAKLAENREALPERKVVPISKAEREAILARMKPGARAYFLGVMGND